MQPAWPSGFDHVLLEGGKKEQPNYCNHLPAITIVSLRATRC